MLNGNFTTQNPFPERLTHSFQLQVASTAPPGTGEFNILKGQSNTARSVQCALLKKYREIIFVYKEKDQVHILCEEIYEIEVKPE